MKFCFLLLTKIGVYDIINGDPALRLHPGLLNSVLSTDIVTEYSYFKDASAYDIDVITLQQNLNSLPIVVSGGRLKILLTYYPYKIASAMAENIF